MFTLNLLQPLQVRLGELGVVNVLPYVETNLKKTTDKVVEKARKICSNKLVMDVTADNLHIRPSSPCLEGKKFGFLEKVDAFYDYGWWNGIVTKVSTGKRYVVFKHINMEKEFIHLDLRPHMEWVDGKWVCCYDI